MTGAMKMRNFMNGHWLLCVSFAWSGVLVCVLSGCSPAVRLRESEVMALEEARKAIRNGEPPDGGVVGAPYAAQTRLAAAAAKGHFSVAAYMLEHGADVNARDDDGLTALHAACALGRYQMVEYLIRHGAAIETEAYSGFTPLHVASKAGAYLAVRKLLQAGANPSVRGDPEYVTPLYLAMESRSLDVAEALLEAGAKPYLDEFGSNPTLVDACRNGDYQMVEKFEAFSEVVDWGMTGPDSLAMEWATRGKHMGIAALLLEMHKSKQAKPASIPSEESTTVEGAEDRADE